MMGSVEFQYHYSIRMQINDTISTYGAGNVYTLKVIGTSVIGSQADGGVKIE